VIAQVYGKRGPSALHRYDPRAKFVLLLAFLLVFFLPIRVGHLALYLGAVVAVTAVFLGLANAFRPVRLILPILILVLLLTPPFHREGTTLISIRGLTILTLPGLTLALRLIIRFTGITVIFYLFVGTTDPDTLILAFRWFRLPFTMSLVLSIALEYIPTIRSIYDQVQDAHRLRLAGAQSLSPPAPGGEGRSSRTLNEKVNGKKRAGRKGLIKRLIDSVPILTSVLILSVRRIPTLAMALECRGVGRRNRRSSYHRLKSGRPLLGDGAIAALIAGGLAASLVLFPDEWTLLSALQ
jgi:energy-coupling factor transporter transmembrane protein EcfT